MVKRNAIATKLTKRCTQTQKRAFDVAVNNKVCRQGDFCFVLGPAVYIYKKYELTFVCFDSNHCTLNALTD